MRIFLDTNVIMEYLCKRKNFLIEKSILDAAFLKAYDACMSSGCFYTLSYLLACFLKENGIHEPEKTTKVRETLISLMAFVSVVDLSEESFKKGLKDLTFKDLEDSYQYYCAIENHCDALITFNMKHFAGRHVANNLILYTPQEFVSMLKSE